MRLLVIMLAGLLISTGCHIRENRVPGGNKPDAEQEAILKDSANYTTIGWLDSTFRDFGRISEGQKLEVSFRFKNTGTKPLVITRVQPSCGCTVAEQPNAPVLPGGEGQIKASFNSEGRTGPNHKTLFVYANTRGTTNNELQFTVTVDKKKW